MEKLVAALNELYPYASILLQDTSAMSCQVASTGTSVSENPLLTKRGFVARIHNGKGLFEYSFSDLSETSLPEVLEVIKKQAASIASVCPIPSDDACIFTEYASFDIDPDDLGTEEIVRRLTDIREKAKAKDERILDIAARVVWQKGTKLFVSKNRALTQTILWTNGSIVALAAKGEEIKDYYKGFSLLGGAEVMNRMNEESVIDQIVNTVIELLDSEEMIPGEYDCICDPETTGMIVHEAFGHGVEMDMFVKNRALAKDFIGKRVASDLVTMHDGAKAENECASYLFDDEGTLGQDTLVIKDGILLTGYADTTSAAKLGVQATGNGRRESFERKAYTRMTNTFFAPGSSTLDEMIASISYGFLLENPSSGMEDPKNWGIQCMVNIAREIKDGKLTGKVFSPIVLTGYVPDLLTSISMMGNEIHLGGSGFCGKGYKEWVKVSDGGPYMKARIRLG